MVTAPRQEREREGEGGGQREGAWLIFNDNICIAC